MSAIEKIKYETIFPGEIIVKRKNEMDIYNTKIDDFAYGPKQYLPEFTKEEKIKHYTKKLNHFWEGKLCLD